MDERKKWNELIDKHITEEKKKEEEKRKRQVERARMMKERLAKVDKEKAQPIKEVVPVEEKSTEELLDSLDDISAVDEEVPKIKFEKKPAVKTLPLPSETPSSAEAKDEPEGKTKTEEEEDLLGALDALGDMEEEAAPNPGKPGGIKKLEITEDLEELSEEIPELQDLIPEKILQYHEKYSLLNGGFVQYELIRDFVTEELKQHGDIPEDLLKTMLTQLKELQMIQSTMEIGEHEFYLFEKVMLSPINKKFIEFAIDKEPLKKEDFSKGLDLPENKIDAAIKYLEKKGILKVENDKIIIPGIVQKK